MVHPFPDPRRSPLGWAVALSLLFHAATFLLGSFVARRGPALGLTPVAVVDLVGGEALSRPGPAAAAPAPKEAPARETKRERRSAKERRSERVPPPSRARAAKAPPPRAAAARKEPDSSEVYQTIRKMREERNAADRISEAVGTLRREEAARQAVRRIGERVARRVEVPPLRPPSGAPPAPRGGGAAAAGTGQGTVRVPPEQLAFFRALDERIRSNWTVPAVNYEEMKKLMVQLRIKIEKDGRVSDVLMEKSSGNPYFDDSVRRAIVKSTPLPVPPEQLRGAENYYDVGFRFYGAGAMR